MKHPTPLQESRFTPSFIGVLRLLRLSNSIPATVLVFLGAYLVDIEPMVSSIWLAAGSMWCVTAFGYVSNDYFDVAEDRINKPDRPIPIGIISTHFAISLAIGLAGGAILLSIPLGLVAVAASSTVLLLLTAYNLWFKNTPGSGNLMIALFAGCALWVGSIAVKGLNYTAIQPLLIPSLLLSIFIMAREILKTIEDIKGDLHVGKQTIAIRWGINQTIMVIAILTTISTLLSIAPFLYSGYSWTYLFVINIGVNLPLFYTVVTLWQGISPSRVSHCLALLKGSYFAGILALLVA